MNKPVLVTGADGFIGTYVCSALERDGYAVARHSIGDGDIANCPLPYAASHVIHLAGKSFVPQSWGEPRGFYEVNVMGTLNVLEFCRREKASLTYISSYVYGQPQELPIPETHPVQAVNPYAHTKIMAESLCQFYSAVHGVKVCVVRPFNIYGPGQDRRFLIPMLVEQALSPAADALEVADDRPKRDLLYVSDLVNLLRITVERGATGIYNAGSGESASVREIAGIIGQIAPGHKPVRSRGECRPQEIPDVVADIGKARRELGWHPTVSLHNGLRNVVEAAARKIGASEGV